MSAATQPATPAGTTATPAGKPLSEQWPAGTQVVTVKGTYPGRRGVVKGITPKIEENGWLELVLVELPAYPVTKEWTLTLPKGVKKLIQKTYQVKPQTVRVLPTSLRRLTKREQQTK
jgi:hypothetical protein